MLDKKQVFIFSLAGTLILALLLMFILTMASNKENCKLVASKPEQPKKPLENIASKNFDALATFFGYLAYNSTDDDQVYLPLELKSISLDKKKRFLSLNTNCATIDLEVRTNNQYLFVNQIQVSLVRPGAGGVDTCYVEHGSILAAKDYHIECSYKRTYRCYKKLPGKAEDWIADFVFYKLEFETNSDPEQAKKKKYTTYPQHCDRWNDDEV